MKGVKRKIKSQHIQLDILEFRRGNSEHPVQTTIINILNQSIQKNFLLKLDFGFLGGRLLVCLRASKADAENSPVHFKTVT